MAYVRIIFAMHTLPVWLHSLPSRARWLMGLSFIVVLYIALAVAYGVVTPVLEGPDEVGHVLYVKHILEGRGIPVQSREYAISYGFGQEGSQTPLYYALNAGLLRLVGGGRSALSDLKGVPPHNPFSTCGQPQGEHNVARYRHHPHQESFPYQGAARAVHMMRLLSALLGAGTVVAVYAAARLAFPDSREAALLAAVVVAFNPQFAFMGGVVNNDNLVNCLTTAAVALTLYCLTRGFTWPRTLALGLVCGLAPLAKLGGLMAPVFAGIGLLASIWMGPRTIGREAKRPRTIGREAKRPRTMRREAWGANLKSAICHLALLGGAFVAVAGWWFVRNWMLYGDPTGVNVMRSIYGGRDGWPSHLIIPEIVNTFRSYWSAFACELSFPAPIHWGLAALIGLGVLGWVKAWRTTSLQQKRVAGLLFLWLGIVIAFWVRWNQVTYAPLGRLFFQANAAIGALLGYGLARLTPRPRFLLAGVSAGLWTLAIAGALLVVRPAFALPARYSVSADITPSQPLSQTTFNDQISVLGYEVSPGSLEPGETLEMALFLRATRPITEDYAMALQLLSPVPGDDAALLNFNTIPGDGNYPTYAWRPDEVIVDRYRLRIPEQVERTQAWQVVAVLYHLSGGGRLPVTVGGQSGGQMLGLGMVRVGASESPTVPTEARLEPGPLFGDADDEGAIRLEGIRLELEGDVVRVQAWWRSEARVSKDYTAFVHLYDEHGAVLAAGDAPPLEGAFPSSLWDPGDLIVDEYLLSSKTLRTGQTLEEQGARVGIGWYDPATGVRLPISGDASETAALFSLFSGPTDSGAPQSEKGREAAPSEAAI